MRKIVVLAAVLALSPAMAQTVDFGKTTEQVVDLGHGVFAILPIHATADIGNTTVAVGRDGLIVVDSQFAPLYPLLKSKITGLSSLPVKYVINTHFHDDHSGGNAAFAKDGAIIVAHQNVPSRMANDPKTKGTVPKEALPTETYSGQGTEISVRGQKAELVHLGPGHTDGDTIVFWPAADVVSVGDLERNPGYPNFGAGGGGSLDGLIVAANFVVAHTDAKTKIVPGHGKLMTRADAIAWRNMLVTARARIARAKARGMSEDQTAKAHLLADFDKTWKGNGGSEDFPVNIYRAIK